MFILLFPFYPCLKEVSTVNSYLVKYTFHTLGNKYELYINSDDKGSCFWTRLKHWN